MAHFRMFGNMVDEDEGTIEVRGGEGRGGEGKGREGRGE